MYKMFPRCWTNEHGSSYCAHRTGNRCPTLGLLVPNAWSVDAQRLVPECPFDGQDRPFDGL